ncbi:MAG: DNRLRE domain-containing protein [Myxococcota bacterium]|nr:DNRLRE domain-containing protein [Myxococcota bacterium]
MKHLWFLLCSLLLLPACGSEAPNDDDTTAANNDDAVDDDDSASDDDDAVDDDDSASDDDDAVDDDDDSASDDDDSASDDDDDDDSGPPLFEPTRWRSSLYPEAWLPGFSVGDLLLQDFSYAGYHLGEDPLPSAVAGPVLDVTDPTYGADPTGSSDSTAAIQAALDDAGSLGGGTVFLPEGSYLVAPPGNESSALRIRYDGVVLRGAGRELTFLINTRTEMRNRQVIRIEPNNSVDWTSATGMEVLLTADGVAGDTSVEVADGSAFSTDDLVLARSSATEAWIADHDMTGDWTSASLQGPTFLRRVVAVSGDTVELDIPLRYPLLLRDQARLEPAGPHVAEVGLEDFSLGMVQHPGTEGWADADYNTPGTPAYEVHGSDAIRVQRAIDSWVLRVGSFQPSENTAQAHLLSDGLTLIQARSVTVQDTQFSHPQYEGYGGNGYSYVIQGGDNLCEDCGTVSARHGFSFKKPWASGNVIRGGSSSNPRHAVDFHMHLSMANLIDGLTLEADFLDASYRPYGTVVHGHTTTRSVLWNTAGVDGTDGQLVDSRQFERGYAIGTRGRPFDVTTTPLVDTKDTSPEDHLEGEGTGQTLSPESLYLDQLSRRLTGAPLPTGVELATLPTFQDAYVRSGTHETSNFDTSVHLESKDAGGDYERRSFLTFDLSSLARSIERATLVLDCETTDSNGTVADLRAHAVEDDTWTEANLNWLTQPNFGAFLSRGQTNDLPAQLALDVTEHVRSEQAGDGLASLALIQDMGGSGLLTRCSSREGGVPPTLEVELAPADVLTVVSVSSDIAGEGSSAEATIDGDLSTRWSNDDYGGSITWDLGATFDVRGLGLAFFEGSTGLSFFEIRLSGDGIDWTTVDAGSSSGRSEQIEYREWATSWPTRYVRYVGFGSSDSDWNSIAEVLVLGQ